jgi:hypothetical protein
MRIEADDQRRKRGSRCPIDEALDHVEMAAMHTVECAYGEHCSADGWGKS